MSGATLFGRAVPMAPWRAIEEEAKRISAMKKMKPQRPVGQGFAGPGVGNTGNDPGGYTPGGYDPTGGLDPAGGNAFGGGFSI